MSLARSPIVVASIALALLAGVAPIARAQTGVWRQITPPAGDVTAVAPGADGSVLFAAGFGGFRYDGLRTRRLPVLPPGADSLSGSAILEAANGDVWIASNLPGSDGNGLYRLQPGGTVTRFTAGSGLGNSLSDQVLDLAETPDGTIWAGMNNGGLSRFDGNLWTTITTDQGLPTMTVKSIAVDPADGSLWVGTLGTNAGLAHVVNGAIATVVRGFTLTPTTNVRAVLVTRDRDVWVGSDAGVARLNGAAFEEYGAGTSVTALAEGAHGEIWFGTGNQGVGRWDAGALRILPAGPPSGVIRDLYVDPAGVLWVATGGGAARFEGAAWLSYSKVDRLPTTTNVFAALRDLSSAARGDSIDADGIVWMGGSPTSVSPTQHLTLVRRANGRLSTIGTEDGLPVGVLRALAAADSGAIWCGTSTTSGSGGVARVTAAGLVTHALVAPGSFPSSNVFALADAGGGAAWAATPAGGVRFDRAGFTTLPTGPGAMPDAPLVGVTVDAQGRVWFASGDPPSGNDRRPPAGAVRFDPADSSYLVLDVAAGLPTNRLAGVAVAPDGAVWFASVAGAIRFDAGGLRTFSIADGLPANDVTGIAASPDGRIWAATTAGLAFYDGAQWSSANVSDGLAGTQIESVFADAAGVIAACGIDGVSLLHPDRTPPRVEIVSGPPPATGASTVQFALRAGDLDSDANRVLVSTELVGRAPTPFAEEVDAVGLELLDGDYVFRVRAKDRALNETPEPVEWPFTVDATPPRPVVEAPAFNAVVKDTVDVVGRIVDPRFAMYLVELRREGTVPWDTLFTSSTPPAPTAPLYRWASREVNDGVWELRVGVTDSLGLIGYAQVSVIVDNFAPSASVTSPATVDHVTGGRVFSTNGEVDLYVPPNAWPADQIVRILPLPIPEGGFLGARRPLAAWTVLADDMTLDKPATLSMALPLEPEFPAAVALAPLASAPSILRLVITGADTTLVPLGGSKSADGTRVTTSVDELGAFVLVDATPSSGAGFEGARDLDCQPRVLSPKGGGFDTRTAISFELGRPATGAVKVYDRAGRLVKEIAESGDFLAGQNVVFWDGTDGDGQIVPSGLYTVAVRFDGETSVRTVVVANK